VIAGAGLWQGQKMVRGGGFEGQGWVFVAGFIASAVTGFFVIRFFLAFLKKHTLYPFVVYRVALAVVVLILVSI
jgi:undecaprenyl-diphosphatase